jgi:4-hydroxy-3-methylbut-2-en-1-yl diphosphate synthase IspG/GcpE
MGSVMIRCLRTGRALKTGVWMENLEADLSSLGMRAVSCPYCGRMHMWSKKNAWVDREQRQSQALSAQSR